MYLKIKLDWLRLLQGTELWLADFAHSKLREQPERRDKLMIFIALQNHIAKHKLYSPTEDCTNIQSGILRCLIKHALNESLELGRDLLWGIQIPNDSQCLHWNPFVGLGFWSKLQMADFKNIVTNASKDVGTLIYWVSTLGSDFHSLWTQWSLPKRQCLCQNECRTCAKIPVCCLLLVTIFYLMNIWNSFEKGYSTVGPEAFVIRLNLVRSLLCLDHKLIDVPLVELWRWTLHDPENPIPGSDFLALLLAPILHSTVDMNPTT